MLQGVRWFGPCWSMANADEAQELLWGAGHVGGGLVSGLGVAQALSCLLT